MKPSRGHIRFVARFTRLDAGAEMEGWGSGGPVFGPLAYVHAAYLSTMQIGFPDGERVELPVTGDLIEWDGVYYGDYEVFTRSDAMAPVRRVQRVRRQGC